MTQPNKAHLHSAPLMMAFQAPAAEGELLDPQAGAGQTRARILQEFANWTSENPKLDASPSSWLLLETWWDTWQRMIDPNARWEATKLIWVNAEMQLLARLLLRENVISLASYQRLSNGVSTYVECWLRGLMERNGTDALEIRIEMAPRAGDAGAGQGIRVQ